VVRAENFTLLSPLQRQFHLEVVPTDRVAVVRRPHLSIVSKSFRQAAQTTEVVPFLCQHKMLASESHERSSQIVRYARNGASYRELSKSANLLLQTYENKRPGSRTRIAARVETGFRMYMKKNGIKFLNRGKITFSPCIRKMRSAPRRPRSSFFFRRVPAASNLGPAGGLGLGLRI
jgi:hypothetical protein